MVTRLPRLPRLPHVFLFFCFLGDGYIYSRLIILYIINLLSLYTETWRVTGVTEVTR